MESILKEIRIQARILIQVLIPTRMTVTPIMEGIPTIILQGKQRRSIAADLLKFTLPVTQGIMTETIEEDTIGMIIGVMTGTIAETVQMTEGNIIRMVEKIIPTATTESGRIKNNPAV